METDLEKQRTNSVLSALLVDIADILRVSADSIFGVSGEAVVLTEDDGDLDNRISGALGHLGLEATVMLAGLQDAAMNLPSPCFRQAEIIVEIAEASALNRSAQGTQVPAIVAAEQAATALHHARLTSGRIVYVTQLQRYAQAPAPADVCWHLHLSTGEVRLAAATHKEI